MIDKELMHDWMVSYLEQKLSRDYESVKVNMQGEKKYAFNNGYPDLILGNHGFVMAVVEVETEETVSFEKAEEWKALARGGTKLIVMVPHALKAKAVDLLWRTGIADRAAVGTYGITVNMP